jgi:iron-regulated transporter 1
VFAIVTTFSCFAILASVGLQNAISRDWVVEITTPEELTTMNAWMRSIGENESKKIN